MFESKFVDFSGGPEHLDLNGLPIIVDPDDYEGIQIAARNLAEDIERVTGQKAEIWTNLGDDHIQAAIVVGSLEKSKFNRELMQKDHLRKDDNILGKWECYQTDMIRSPWPLVDRKLVISGSDQRGTIFGIYSLSEQIGVSPYSQLLPKILLCHQWLMTNVDGTGGQMWLSSVRRMYMHCP